MCPSLAQKYNIPYDACCLVAWLLEADAFNHVVPDSVYYCEKLKVSCYFANPPTQTSNIPVLCFATMQFCPVLPHGAATFSSITVLQKPTQAINSTPRIMRPASHLTREPLVSRHCPDQCYRHQCYCRW